MLRKLLKELTKQKYKTLLSNSTEKQLNGTKKVSFSRSCLKSSSNHSPIKVESSCPRWYLYFSLPKQEVKMKQRRLKMKIKKVKSLRFFLNMGMISDRITQFYSSSESWMKCGWRRILIWRWCSTKYWKQVLKWDSLSLFKIQMLSHRCTNGESGPSDHSDRNAFTNGLNKKSTQFILSKILKFLQIIRSQLLKQIKQKIKTKRLKLLKKNLNKIKSIIKIKRFLLIPMKIC